LVTGNWQLRAVRTALPAVQLAHDDLLEWQILRQYAFDGGALRLYISRGSSGGEIFAALTDTRVPAYRGFADLGSTEAYAVYRDGPYALVLPTDPVSAKTFVMLKARQWLFADLHRLLGAPSVHWHIHGVGYSGFDYIPQGLSFILDQEGATDPGLYQLNAGVGDDLPSLDSLAGLDYAEMQRAIRNAFANEILCQREEIDHELANGTSSPNGHFIAAPINLGGLANTQEVAIRERGKPEWRYPAPHFIESDCLWLGDRTVVFKIGVPQDSIYSLDISSGASREIVSSDKVREFGISGRDELWYTTGDGQRHPVTVPPR
jgi:hypothetical protein